MTTTYAPDVTDKFTTQFVRRAARELVADGFYPESDLEDVMQDLLTHLIERLPKFDPDTGRSIRSGSENAMATAAKRRLKNAPRVTRLLPPATPVVPTAATSCRRSCCGIIAACGASSGACMNGSPSS